MSWDGKSKGKVTGYKIFVLLLKIGGLRAAYSLLYFVSFYYIIFSHGKTKISYRFYRTKIKQGKYKACRSVYRNYYALGQSIIDKIAVMSGIKTDFHFNFDGENYLQQLADDKKGAILMGAHVGNWEIAGHYLNRIKVPINIVMYDNEYQQIKLYLDSVSGDKNYKAIAITEDGSHIFEIITALNNNEFVCLHADRYFKGSKTITHSFLGENAQFSESIFRMCAALNKPVVFVYAFKEKVKSYHFYATQPVVFSGNKTEKTDHLLSAFVNELEQKTLQYSLHWFNFYDFWTN